MRKSTSRPPGSKSLIYCLWSRYGIRQAIIFLPCGLFYLSMFLFSSPNLSRHRLDVYHTSSSTHGVALVRIWDAGLKCAARGSLKIQDAKNLPPGHHRTTLSGHVFAIKACIDNWEKGVKQQYLLYMSSQYGNFSLQTAEITSLGHPSTFQRVSRLGSVTARHSSSGRQPNFAGLNRGRRLYSTGRPSRWALARIVV